MHRTDVSTNASNFQPMNGIKGLGYFADLRTCGPNNGYFADLAADVGPQNTHRRTASPQNTHYKAANVGLHKAL